MRLGYGFAVVLASDENRHLSLTDKHTLKRIAPFPPTTMDERRIANRYLSMPLDELRTRKIQLEQEQANGRLSHGKRVYRRRIKKAIETREGEQEAAQRDSLQHQASLRLREQALYDQGYDTGRRDAQSSRGSSEWDFKNPEQRRGYRDGYRSVPQQRTSSWGW